jgi:hypothetical protein
MPSTTGQYLTPESIVCGHHPKITSNCQPHCDSFPPPPLTRPPQGGSKQNDPLVYPSGSLHFYPIKFGLFRVAELCSAPNHGTHSVPIATTKGSNRGQRLKTTGRPLNTSRARKCSISNCLRRTTASRGFGGKARWQGDEKRDHRVPYLVESRYLAESHCDSTKPAMTI